MSGRGNGGRVQQELSLQPEGQELELLLPCALRCAARRVHIPWGSLGGGNSTVHRCAPRTQQHGVLLWYSP